MHPALQRNLFVVKEHLGFFKAANNYDILDPASSEVILHCREDQCIPFKAGLNLAAGIPGAEFVQLESDNHILTEDEPAWGELQQAIINFTGVQVAKENAVFEQLSVREREILAHMIEGETNPEIGRSLFISEKTVRNHVTHIFGKLGVSNRAQAMVLARDNGFRP